MTAFLQAFGCILALILVACIWVLGTFALLSMILKEIAKRRSPNDPN